MAVPGFFRIEEGAPETAAGPNVKGIYHASLYSTDYLMRLYRMFTQAYSVNKENEIGQLAGELVEAAAEVWQKHPDLCD
jgi:hypothetical protein